MHGLILTLANPGTALLVAAGLTVILFLESSRFPWSPFFLLHAVLAIVIPVIAGAWPAGNFFTAISRRGETVLLFFLLLACWEHFVSGYLYERKILTGLGRDRDPYYSPSLALAGILERSARNLGISVTAAQSLFAAYALLWAPFGEGLFFWGYLHANLGSALGFWPATLSVSTVFAAHHILYLGALGNRRPWGSLIAFAVSAFVTAILMSLLFRSMKSLFPLMAVQAGVNLVWVAVSMLSPRPSATTTIHKPE